MKQLFFRRTLFLTIFSTFTILATSTITMAEGIADRRHDSLTPMTSSQHLQRIHQQHGPSAAGPTKSMHEPLFKRIKHKRPKYHGQRHNKEFHQLRAHEYRRKTVGGK